MTPDLTKATSTQIMDWAIEAEQNGNASIGQYTQTSAFDKARRGEK